MSVNLAALAPSIFLSKNYVNGDANDAGAFQASSGDSYKHRVYDMDRDSYWVSVGSSDAVEESLVIGLYEGSYQTSRTIDFVALMGINLKRFLLEYSNDDGATWTTVPGADYSAADYAADNLILSLASSITANKLRLTMYSTQTANEEKQVAEIIAALVSVQTAYTFSEYDPDLTPTIKEVRMADGSIDYGVVRRSDSSFHFYSADVKWEFMSSANKESLFTIAKSAEPFLWYPEPGDNPDEIYLCRFKPGSLKARYSIKYRAVGYTVSAVIQEVGGC